MASLEELFSCFDDEPKYGESSKPKSKRPKKKKKKLNKRCSESHDEHFSPKMRKTSISEDIYKLNSTTYNFEIKLIFQNEMCIHQVAYCKEKPLPDLIFNLDNPAKTYKFELDMFQKQSILCIDNNQSVLVSAHTSAGKTVVAEYAIALSLKSKQRVIYTSPIKALSNQKFRELSDEFKDVGLMTGDVTNEPKSSCIVMTTEVLRDMLYRGSEMIKEVKWIIFDEIHYMRDPSRGVVWEETMILLPDSIRCVFLSATIPNAQEFAEWITFLHKEPCNIVYTEHRPTPLEHYVFTMNNNLELVVDKKGNFLKDRFEIAMEDGKKEIDHVFDKKQDSSPSLNDLIDIIFENNWSPVLVFSFSKIECESKALIFSQKTLTTVDEQALIEEIFNNAINLLNPEERLLPHVVNIIPLLRNGIAFHHSGLLPIIKEIIEILFGEGLIKILFATETFAMGLNMPAKTVVFAEINKFDGTSERTITSGEYIQMSGRAGRRGIDDKGIVIINSVLKDDIFSIHNGKADPLNSSFHLSYRMILNLLRLEEINPEYLINKSFLSFQRNRKIKQCKQELEKKEKEMDLLEKSNNQLTIDYFKLKNIINQNHEVIRSSVITVEIIENYVKTGSVIKLKVNDLEYDWGIVLSMETEKVKIKINDYSRNKFEKEIKIIIMLNVEPFETTKHLPPPCFDLTKGVVHVFTVSYKLIYQISSEFINIRPFDEDESKFHQFRNEMQSLKSSYPNGLPLLHPVHDMKIDNCFVKKIINDITYLEKRLISHKLHKIYSKHMDLSVVENINQLDCLNNKIESLKKEILSYKDDMEVELKKRIKVLRELNYCDEVNVVSFKGRIACEFSVHELLLSEILFNGILNTIPVDICVGILSCLCCKEKSKLPFSLLDPVNDTYNSIKNIIRNISDVSYKAGLLHDEFDLVHDFNSTIINVLVAWCSGASFLEVCNMTEVYEGSVIRYMREIDEILKYLYKASRNIGNPDLEVKFSEGIKRLKRGIVFTSSLYL